MLFPSASIADVAASGAFRPRRRLSPRPNCVVALRLRVRAGGGVAMSGVFHGREQSYEAKFAHDEALRFRIRARRDKLFARWAVAALGLSDEQTEAAVRDVLAIKDGPDHDQALK